MQQIVLSAIGPDKPGIVDQLTKVVEELGGNWADSRMINLRGQFAVVARVEIGDDQLGNLRANLESATGHLNLTLSLAPADHGEATIPLGIPYRIRTYAMDQVGLVHRITHLLHTLQVNIEELNTQLDHAPHSGTPLFTMDMNVTIPKDLKLKELREKLEQLCAELNCDLDLDRV